MLNCHAEHTRSSAAAAPPSHTQARGPPGKHSQNPHPIMGLEQGRPASSAGHVAPTRTPLPGAVPAPTGCVPSHACRGSPRPSFHAVTVQIPHSSTHSAARLPFAAFTRRSRPSSAAHLRRLCRRRAAQWQVIEGQRSRTAAPRRRRRRGCRRRG